eukprot:c8730_g1_i1.p3 GENE.c8730_g1_i1~~c8730_g1_i1.p3  ORF type:complete len:104 (+),score=15.19 c8730_g1_i1:601-912(+)
MEKTGRFPKAHAQLGMITGVVAFCSFVADAFAQVLGDEILPVVVVTMVLWGLVLFPVWLLSLGLLLNRADQALGELELEEQRMIPPPPATLVDDIDIHDLHSP